MNKERRGAVIILQEHGIFKNSILASKSRPTVVYNSFCRVLLAS